MAVSVTRHYFYIKKVPVRTENIPQNAFITKNGLYEYFMMPFGLCHAPATFQWLIEVAMNGLLWNTCFIYLDDLDDHFQFRFRLQTAELGPTSER